MPQELLRHGIFDIIRSIADRSLSNSDSLALLSASFKELIGRATIRPGRLLSSGVFAAGMNLV